jgi:hypothetical protein
MRQSKRIIFDAVVCFAVLFLPWQFFIFFVFAGGLVFQNYFEAFIFGLFMDALYGTPAVNFHGFHLFFAFASLSLIFITGFLKTKIRIFEK